MIYYHINQYLKELSGPSIVSHSHWTLKVLWQRYGRERIDEILSKLWKLEAQKKQEKDAIKSAEWVNNLLNK